MKLGGRSFLLNEQAFRSNMFYVFVLNETQKIPNKLNKLDLNENDQDLEFE